MGHSEGRYVRYEEEAHIISSVKGKMLRKTSDSRDLAAAIDKLKDKYGLKSGQVNRVLTRFQKLGISPITLSNYEKNSSKLEQLNVMLTNAVF